LRASFKIAAFFLFNSCLAVFLTYGVFFNVVAAELGQPPTSTAFVFAAFAILYGLSSLLMGFLIARIGPSKTILLGGTLMATGMVLSSVANSLPALVLAYAVVGGAGSGSMWPTTSFSVLKQFDQEELRHVTGIVSAGTAFGSLFFAPLEAFLISEVEWRATFLILGVIIIAFALFGAVAATGSPRGDAHNIRAALSRARNKRFGSLYSYYMFGNGVGRSIVMVFIVPMLQSQGFSLFVGSLALSMIGLGSIFGRFASGSKRLSEEQICGLSFILQGAAGVMLLYTGNVLAIALLALLFGVGYGGYIPQFPLLVRKYFGMREFGSVFGLLLSSYSLGAFAGPLFAGYTLEVFGTFTYCFIVASFISIIAGVHQVVNYRVNDM